MQHLNVHSARPTDTDPDQVWAVVRDFCAPWHPAVQGMEPERDRSGALIRRFTVRGEDTIYRERLTYISNSDRVMRYTCLLYTSDAADE